MAKFCSNCGLQLEDDMKCCPKCGAPVLNDSGVEIAERTHSTSDFNSVERPNYKLPPKHPRRMKVIGLCSLAVIVLFVLIGTLASRISSPDQNIQAAGASETQQNSGTAITSNVDSQQKGTLNSETNTQSQQSSCQNSDENSSKDSGENNIETDSRSLGMKFSFTLDEFTERINAVARVKAQTNETFMTNDDWKNIGTQSSSGTNYDTYSYSMGNGKYTWVANVDIASRKVIAVSMTSPTSVIKSDTDVYFTGLFLYLAAIYNIDYPKAGKLYEEMLNVKKSGVDAICTHDNTILSYITYGDKTSLIIGPISDELESKGNYIELK